LLYKSEQMLHSIEKDIENILHELNDLLDSEKTSRQEIETLEPNIKSLRKNISQNRYQYDKAEAYFDTEIDRMEEGMLNYHYLEVKQLVIHLKENVEELTVQIDEFPAIYRKTRQDLPSQLDELYSGIRGMKEDGYRVDYLAFEEEIQNYQQRLKKCITSLDNG